MQKVLDPGLAKPNHTERRKGIWNVVPITTGPDKILGRRRIPFLPS
jgi:hypothetical protein